MSAAPSPATGDAPRVALFVTCLADLFRPSVAMAAVELLERAGCRVEVPPGQTCCGQPAFNNGDLADARAIARRAVAALEGFDYVVAPSGSCAGMLRVHYPGLLAEDPAWAERAARVAARCWELTSFLVDVRGLDTVDAAFEGTVAYHDSCAGLRELGVREQPRRLLAAVPGLELRELAEGDVCCGFGGTFCVKYPDISTRMADDKLAQIEATGAGVLLGGDLGCLLNLAGRARRRGLALRVFHTAELLTGRTSGPAIGEGEGGR